MSDNNDESKRIMIETTFLIIMMSLLGVFGMYFMPLILLLFPVPFIIFGIRNGIITNIINMIITCMIIGFAGNLGNGLFLLLVFLPATIGISYFIKNKRDNLETIGVSTVLIFISILLVLNLTNLGETDFASQIEKGYQEMMTRQLEILEDAGLTASELEKEKEVLEQTYQLSLLIMPSVLMSVSLAISYINYLLAAIGLNKLGIHHVRTPKFSKFKLPKSIIPGLLLMYLGVFVIEKMGIAYGENIFINLISLSGVLFFIHGLALIDFYLQRFNIPSIIRFITYSMSLFVQSIILIVTLLGFIDNVFDFRSRIKMKS